MSGGGIEAQRLVKLVRRSRRRQNRLTFGTRHPLKWLFCGQPYFWMEATTMGKGNNARNKEKKKPKKAAPAKAIPVKATAPPKKP
jgi:hypothetical protein